MTIQWFYRPDEAKKKRGGLFPTRRANEVFYRWVVHFYVYSNLASYRVRSWLPLSKASGDDHSCNGYANNCACQESRLPLLGSILVITKLESIIVRTLC